MRGVSGRWGLVDAARANLRREWGGTSLSVVALTDGAKTIRADFCALFGSRVRVVLDWYHLAQRVYQQLSMAAHSMREREGWEKQVLAWLWRGDMAGARTFLGALTGRNARALADLLGYLDKHDCQNEPVHPPVTARCTVVSALPLMATARSATNQRWHSRGSAS